MGVSVEQPVLQVVAGVVVVAVVAPPRPELLRPLHPLPHRLPLLHLLLYNSQG